MGGTLIPYMSKKDSLNTIIIDLGKGVVLTAPFKRKWTLAEWRRMTAYIDNITRSLNTEEQRHL